MNTSPELQGQTPTTGADPSREVSLQHALEMAELVAHEINNLLNNILLHIAVVDCKGASNIGVELAMIRQAGTRAGALLNRWQQLTPRRPPALQPVDLNRLAAQAAVGAGTDDQFRFEPGSGLSPVLADPAELQRLIRLLLVNAAAASAPGLVTLRTEQTATEVVLYVEDMGAPIDPALEDRLFEPFLVARHSQATELEPQPDLGLAVCKRLARRQQAAIQIENRPEGGVRMTVRFKPAQGESPVD